MNPKKKSKFDVSSSNEEKIQFNDESGEDLVKGIQSGFNIDNLPINLETELAIFINPEIIHFRS